MMGIRFGWQENALCSVAAAALVLAVGCNRGTVGASDSDGTGTTGDASSSGGGTTSPTAEGPMPDSSTGPSLDMGEPGCGGVSCAEAVDILFVIDNSRQMGHEQQRLARIASDLVQETKDFGSLQRPPPPGLDVQVMVTTTDVSNPVCAPFKTRGYSPANGAPVGTSCTDRLDDFSDVLGEPSPEFCTETCPVPTAPAGNILRYNDKENNVEGGGDVDIDGDGQADSIEAQALACMLPQGINGCGYESPLEAMRLALDLDASWNQGDTPFLRPDVPLVVFILTDEVDCSIVDPMSMEDESLWNTNPDTGQPALTSAMCWNAGVECSAPDASGVYPSCNSVLDGHLHPVSDYSGLLDSLAAPDGPNKATYLIELVGVPNVTHEPNPPFFPTGGGVDDLVYRDWLDGVFPRGDISPEDAAAGQTAEDKAFQWGIGPGCTGTDADGEFAGQASPPVRLLEVCRDLAEADPRRCIVESICDRNYEVVSARFGSLFTD